MLLLNVVCNQLGGRRFRKVSQIQLEVKTVVDGVDIRLVAVMMMAVGCDE